MFYSENMQFKLSMTCVCGCDLSFSGDTVEKSFFCPLCEETYEVVETRTSTIKIERM